MSRKRAAERPLVPVDMDAKHASLMNDYIQLQDEFVALKDRLQAAKIRRATLIAEVRFLRRRLKKLKRDPPALRENQKASPGPQCDSSKAYNAVFQAVAPQPSALSQKNNTEGLTGIPEFSEPHGANGSSGSTKLKPVHENVGLVSALKTSVLMNKTNVLATPMLGKRKISWQDQISLKCI